MTLNFERQVDISNGLLAAHQAAEKPNLSHGCNGVGVAVETFDTIQKNIEQYLSLGSRGSSFGFSTRNGLALFGDLEGFRVDQSTVKALLENDGTVAALGEDRLQITKVRR